MDIISLFKKTLYEEEIYSFMYNEGCYALGNIDYISKPLSINATLIDKVDFPFSKNLKENLILIYNQVAVLSIMWNISTEVNNETLDETPWLKNYRISEGFDYNFLREQLSGAINIVSLEEMFNEKEFKYLKRDGVRYLPFDLHYELMACFKLENNKIEDNIYILNIQDSEISYDMGVGCIKYLELAYKAKLFYQWQYAYMNKQGIDNERLNNMLPVIFPFVELDLSDFN